MWQRGAHSVARSLHEQWPIVAEGKLAGGVGVWIDIEHKVGYKEHTILAMLPVGKRMVWCNAQGPAEVAAVCKSLRP